MKTFLQVLLLVLAAIVALRVLRVAFVVGCLVALPVAGLAIAGVSLVGAALIALLVAAAVLSPVWLPVLAIVGIVALCRRKSRVAA